MLMMTVRRPTRQKADDRVFDRKKLIELMRRTSNEDFERGTLDTFVASPDLVQQLALMIADLAEHADKPAKSSE